MQMVRRQGCPLALVLGAIVLFVQPCTGQASASVNNGSQLPRRIPTPRQLDDPPLDGIGSLAFYEKRMKMLNVAQHQALVSDTDKLVKLVADLNAEINRSNANSLTPEQLRTVAEIEKLAHSVKDKMRMTVNSAADFNGPMSSPFSAK